MTTEEKLVKLKPFIMELFICSIYYRVKKTDLTTRNNLLVNILERVGAEAKIKQAELPSDFFLVGK